MSVESLTVVLHHSPAKGTDKVVLLGIANHDGDGGAWPSVATLAKYANINDRGVQKVLARLEESGQITRSIQQGGTLAMRSDQRPNMYVINVRCPDGCDRTTAHRVPARASQDPPVRADTPPPVRADTPPPVRADTLTIHEPSNEPSEVHTSIADAPDQHDICRGCGTDVQGLTSHHCTLHLLDFTQTEPQPVDDSEATYADPTIQAKTPARPDVDALLVYLADAVEARGHFSRPKSGKGDHDAMRRMLDIDGRTPDGIRKAITWATGNDFWCANVRSARALRKHYERMAYDATQAARAPRTSDRGADILRAEMARAVQNEAQRGTGTPDTSELPMLDMMRNLPTEGITR